jgi:DNA-directed RNA polymerase specialized sigma subunit
MSESNQLERTFQIIMKHIMETGQAPHHTEIAAELDVPVEEGRKALHELFSPGFPAWLYPNTDCICTFPQFSNLPPNTASL